jgi:hypothetical protein
VAAPASDSSARAYSLAGRQRLLELAHVAADHAKVEAQVVACRVDRLLAQRLPQDVDGIGQQAASPLGIGFGPEEAGKAVAGHGAGACERQDGQQRQAAARVQLEVGERRGAMASRLGPEAMRRSAPN